MKNYNIFSHNPGWDNTIELFSDMQGFRTGCFCYKLIRPLSYEEQSDFVEFLNNSDNMNHLPSTAFCIYFLRHQIPFYIKWEYTPQISLPDNLASYRIVRTLNRQIRKIQKGQNQ